MNLYYCGNGKINKGSVDIPSVFDLAAYQLPTSALRHVLVRFLPFSAELTCFVILFAAYRHMLAAFWLLFLYWTAAGRIEYILSFNTLS